MTLFNKTQNWLPELAAHFLSIFFYLWFEILIVFIKNLQTFQEIYSISLNVFFLGWNILSICSFSMGHGVLEVEHISCNFWYMFNFKFQTCKKNVLKNFKQKYVWNLIGQICYWRKGIERHFWFKKGFEPKSPN